MKSFKRFLTLLAGFLIPAAPKARCINFPHVLLFSILAVVSGANSYQTIHTFIETHWRKLKKAFRLTWKRAPSRADIWYILSRLDAAAVEKVFREHADALDQSSGGSATRAIGIDGKTLRRSFDALHDVKARQILNAFAVDSLLVLAHIEIDEKTNEIPAAQKLFAELALTDRIVTLDAMHCQKKPSKPPKRQARI